VFRASISRRNRKAPSIPGPGTLLAPANNVARHLRVRHAAGVTNGGLGSLLLTSDSDALLTFQNGTIPMKVYHMKAYFKRLPSVIILVGIASTAFLLVNLVTAERSPGRLAG